MKNKFDEKEIKEAFDNLNKIKEVVKFKNKLPLVLGQLLYKAKEDKWLEKNKMEKSEFLSEMGINEKTLFSYENIFKAFCLSAGYSVDELSSINFTRLTKLRPFCFKTKRKGLPEMKVKKDIIDELLASAKVLSTTDFNILIAQRFKGKKIGECKHNWKEKHLWRCRECGEISYVQPEDNKK